MQTHATNPAVSASAMVQPDLLSERQHLEKLYTFDSLVQSEATVMESSTNQALQDVDALLQDLHSLDAELEFALEAAKEDFSELTVSYISISMHILHNYMAHCSFLCYQLANNCFQRPNMSSYFFAYYRRRIKLAL